MKAPLALVLLLGVLSARAQAARLVQDEAIVQEEQLDHNLGPLSHGRIKVNFYGESLCPFCIEFLNITIGGMLEQGLDALMDFKYFAYGNAKYDSSSGAISCQHGPLECTYNAVLNCAMHMQPGIREWYPFVHCIESSARDKEGRNVDALVGKCARATGLDLDSLTQCYQGPLGAQLVMQAREATEALQPPHKWVPWVAANDIPLFEGVAYLPTLVCAAYTGPDRPAGCFVNPVPDDDVLRGPRQVRGCLAAAQLATSS